MSKILSSLLPLLIIGLTGTAGAQVYKWKDADGQIHYGSQPPPSVKNSAKELEIKTPFIDSAAERAMKAQSNSATDEPNMDEIQGIQSASDIKGMKNPESCKKAKAIYAQYQVYGVSEINPLTGVEQQKSGKEAAKIIEQAKFNVDLFCEKN